MSQTDKTEWVYTKETRHAGGSIFSQVLRSIASKVEKGRLEITLPTNRKIVIQGSAPGPEASVTVKKWSVIAKTLMHGDIGFAKSFIRGDVLTPNLVKLFDFALVNSKATAVACLEGPRPFRQLWHVLNRNTLNGSRRNIMAHYDLGNDFYAHWLDKSMNYSSAVFSHDSQTLEEAQQEKLDRIVNMLDLEDEHSVLEIGCGWGALAERLAKRTKGRIHGITLSPAQLDFAKLRVKNDEHVDLELRDYRHTSGSYDRIVSIEMLEAVGAEYWANYFATLKARLRSGGVAVLQAITIAEDRYESYRRNPDFIQKYIFPGGMLPTETIIRDECAAAGLKLAATETFGSSYARTLGEWQNRFQNAWPSLARMGFDSDFRRTWEYYLDYCRAGFAAGTVNVGLYKVVQA